jgi:predicted amidophosphoribosyltransferase
VARVAAGAYLPSFGSVTAADDLISNIRRSKVSYQHDEEFAQLLAAVATRGFPGFQPDLVVSVPERPGAEDRFGSVRTEVARQIAAADVGAVLRQRWGVPNYRKLTRAESREASAGRFVARRPAVGRRVLLIDDVVTSGTAPGQCTCPPKGLRRSTTTTNRREQPAADQVGD